MSAIGDRAALQAGVEAVTREAGGAVEVEVVRPADVPELLGEALAGNEDAALLLRLFHDTVSKAAAAPAGRRLLCVSCPRELQRGFTVAAALPHRDSPHQAIALGVCPRCGPDRAAAMEKAVAGFARIWMGLRPVEVTHPTGGRA